MLDAYVAKTFVRMFRVKTSILTHFKCSRCARCCRMTPAQVTQNEVREIATQLGMKNLKKFKRKYLVQTPETIYIRSSPCVFLSGNRCTIYEVRPEVCKIYPFNIQLPILTDIEGCTLARDIKQELDRITPLEESKYRTERDKVVEEAVQKATDENGLTLQTAIQDGMRQLEEQARKATREVEKTKHLVADKEELDALADKLGRNVQLENERLTELFHHLDGEVLDAK